ncbi:MAG: hypothetical protein ACI9YB_003505 [Halioglobus sp.]|jgi:hypothetical protein
MKIPSSTTDLIVESTSKYIQSDVPIVKKALASRVAAVALPILGLLDFGANAASGVFHAVHCLRGRASRQAHGKAMSMRFKSSVKGLINVFKYTLLLIPNLIKPSLTFNKKFPVEDEKKLHQLRCAKKVLKNWKKAFLTRKLARLQAEQNILKLEDGTCTLYLNRLGELNDCVEKYAGVMENPPSYRQSAQSYFKSFDFTSFSDYVIADPVKDHKSALASSKIEAMEKARETEDVHFPDSLSTYQTPWHSFLSNNLNFGSETVSEEISRQQEAVLNTYAGRMTLLNKIDEEISGIKERHGVTVAAQAPAVVPAPVVQEAPVVQQRSNFDTLKGDISNADMFLGVTWNTFLSKFGPDPVSFWMHDKETGDFTMKFKKPLKMWTDLRLFEGGEIFHLDKRVKGKLKNEKMTFSEGFNVVAKFPVLGIIQPRILSMEVSGDDTLNVKAKYSLLPSQTIPFPIVSLLEGWNYGSEIVEGDPVEHIQAKLSSSLPSGSHSI